MFGLKKVKYPFQIKKSKKNLLLNKKEMFFEIEYKFLKNENWNKIGFLGEKWKANEKGR